MEGQRLFQLVELNPEEYHAGSKATQDVASIAEQIGFAVVPIRSVESGGTTVGKLKRQTLFSREFRKAYRAIPSGAVVLLQHPFHHVQLTREKTLRRLKNRKKVSFICLVHDVQEMRTVNPDRYYSDEFAFMLDIADVLIVHNKTMYEWFVRKGVAPEKLVTLEMFDYLVSGEEQPTPKMDCSITVAGNLAPEKSGYVYCFPEDYGLDVHLYGPHYAEDKNMNPYIRYHGIFHPDRIPEEFFRGYMLVWDGASPETCAGAEGQYLRYNNPHKLSLSIAAGMPVAIWDQATAASFVSEHGIGICTASLLELPDKIKSINKQTYDDMTAAVRNVREKLINGAYTKSAIRKALTILEGEKTNG